MNQMYKAISIEDSQLQQTIDTCVTSSFELLKKTKFRSVTWDIYISGVAYGMWISMCDLDKIGLSEIANSINSKVSIRLN